MASVGPHPCTTNTNCRKKASIVILERVEMLA